MQDAVFVKPIEGVLVRFPRTKTPLPETGAMVPLVGREGVFWRRRIKDGSVVVLALTAPAEPKPISDMGSRRTRRKEE